MKREIKFRAFMISENRMIDNYNISTSIETYYCEDLNNVFKDADYIFMQFIDHEDSEGVDMYEDDILISNGLLYVITWNDTICAFQAKSVSNGSNWAMDSSNIISSLIIGNIHQHPELL